MIENEDLDLILGAVGAELSERDKLYSTLFASIKAPVVQAPDMQPVASMVREVMETMEPEVIVDMAPVAKALVTLSETMAKFGSALNTLAKTQDKLLQRLEAKQEVFIHFDKEGNAIVTKGRG